MNASNVVQAGSSERASAVQRVCFWALFCVLLAAFSLPTYHSLAERWVDYTYSHGYLIAALALFLVVRELRARPFGELRPSPFGLAVLVVAGAGVVAAHAATTSSAAQVLLPVAWFGAVWALVGLAEARRLLAPIAFIYFAIPWWDVINEVLQALTVVVVTFGLRVSDVPAFIDGNTIHISSGIFEVAGGCSGLHYVIVAAALATFSGLLHHDEWKPRIVLLVVALALALLANWLRVFAIIVAGHLTDMQHYLIVKDHYYFGWALFAVCMVPLFVLDRRLQSRADTQPPLAGAPQRRAAGGAVPQPGGAVALVALTLATLAVGGFLGHSATSTDFESSSRVALVLPEGAGWAARGEWLGDTRPVYAGATAEAAGWYEVAGTRLGVFAAHYSHQTEGQEAVFFANRPEGTGSRVVREERRIVGAGRGAKAFVELETLDAAGGRWLVWYQLRVAGVSTDSNIVAKLLQAWGVVTGRPAAQVVVLAAECAAPDCGAAREMLAERAAEATAAVYSSVDGRAAALLGRGS